MDPVFRSTVLKYYKRPEIQNAIVDAAKDKEIAVSYGGKGYGKRPDALTFPSDVLAFAKNGSTSFHCSEETWSNPLAIRTGMARKEADEIRKGWDLVLDIDCPELEYARICAKVLVDAILYHGISSVSTKYSGNNGFHIAVAFEAFPKTIQGTALETLFPEGPRRVATYLIEFMRETLKQQLLERFSIDEMAKRLDKTYDDFVKNGVFDPYEVMKIDTVLISSRHLYRMPYSLHEKSGLVSLPIENDQIMSFSREWAKPEVVKPNKKFLDRSKVVPGEATKLLVQALDFNPPTKNEDKKVSLKQKEYVPPEHAIPEELFPPCVQKIFSGLEDGKKRAMFILTNFLKCAGWDHDKIQERMNQWNEKNPEPIREVILKGHLRHHQKTGQVLPPSCANKAYYKDLQVCHPDNLCNKIKNPVSYAKRKAWALQQNAPKRRKKKTDKKETANNKQSTDSSNGQTVAPDTSTSPKSKSAASTSNVESQKTPTSKSSQNIDSKQPSQPSSPQNTNKE